LHTEYSYIDRIRKKISFHIPKYIQFKKSWIIIAIYNKLLKVYCDLLLWLGVAGTAKRINRKIIFIYLLGYKNSI